MIPEKNIPKHPILSKREKDVVNLLLEGKSNKLIALELGITDRTVEFHLRNIYVKYGVNSRLELVLRLESTTDKGNSGKPVISTVDEGSENAENEARFNSWKDWINYFTETVFKFGKESNMETLNSTGNDNAPTSFFESIRAAFLKYSDFQGRAGRPEFWWFMLFVLLVASAFTYWSEVAGSIFLIAVLLPLLAVGSRRLNDIGKSGWWLFYLLVPIGGLVILGILWSQPPVEPFSEDALTA
ncbi:MAG: DUF805 domain-containing protein [Anaerolineaceae bacterium]|jgi:DNA-binding CsgD family transcriptional regulator|nr:DUF805 domain-containing protein [Anaerolineaceae bacterium]